MRGRRLIRLMKRRTLNGLKKIMENIKREAESGAYYYEPPFSLSAPIKVTLAKMGYEVKERPDGEDGTYLEINWLHR